MEHSMEMFDGWRRRSLPNDRAGRVRGHASGQVYGHDLLMGRSMGLDWDPMEHSMGTLDGDIRWSIRWGHSMEDSMRTSDGTLDETFDGTFDGTFDRTFDRTFDGVFGWGVRTRARVLL